MVQRLHYLNKKLADADAGLAPQMGPGKYPVAIKEQIQQVPAEQANLVSSEVGGNLHAPALDIDGIPCKLYPSKSPGHYHLLIDKSMSWKKYKLLLWVLQFVGIIEKNYYDVSLKRGATFLRTATHHGDGTTEPKKPSMTWQ